MHISLVPCYLNMYSTHVILTSSPHATVKAYARTIVTAACFFFLEILIRVHQI